MGGESERGEDQRTRIYTRPTRFQEKARRETTTKELDQRYQRRERVEEKTKHGSVRRGLLLPVVQKYRRDRGDSKPQ